MDAVILLYLLVWSKEYQEHNQTDKTNYQKDGRCYNFPARVIHFYTLKLTLIMLVVSFKLIIWGFLTLLYICKSVLQGKGAPTLCFLASNLVLYDVKSPTIITLGFV